MRQDSRSREAVRTRWLLLAAGLFALLALLGVASAPTAADAIQVTPLPPVENPDGRAGACFSYYPNDPSGYHPYLQRVHDAGSRWDRFDFIWPSIEQHNNEWHFDAYDDLVDDLDSAGINIVGILLWTPDWAATSGTHGLSAAGLGERPRGWYAPTPGSRANLVPQSTSAASSPPTGLELDWNDPGNHWGDFVYNVVSHYGDRVKHWEMWNEPEWTYFWTGTSTDYARLLKVGYQATKAACSDCTVLFGGLHYWASPDYYKWVLNTLNDDPAALENNFFFDAMSVHLYSRSANTYDVINDIRAGMTARVSDHPIWLTETGVPVWGDGEVPYKPKYDYAATQQEAAAYAIQSYASSWASGVEKYFFFRTNDADMGEYFGLIRNDGSLRSAYVAYQVATTYLVTPTMATRWTYDDGTRRVTLWGTPRGKVSVIWNTTPTTHTFDYPAILPTATLVDRLGVTQTITATDGVYPLALAGATANLVTDPEDYFIGGEPYLVIEADTEDPSIPTVQPLPTTTYSYTVAISCTAHDDLAGMWGYELQWREGAGAWNEWSGIHSAPVLFSSGQHDRAYCFRVRAWDRAGNHSEWAGSEPCTTLDLEREVRFNLEGVFGDENGNEQWDSDRGEVALAELALRFVNAAGVDVVSPTVGSSWAFTTTLMAGEYTLIVEPADWPSLPPGWLPRRESVSIEPGEPADEIHWQIGLLRHRSSALLPIIARED